MQSVLSVLVSVSVILLAVGLPLGFFVFPPIVRRLRGAKQGVTMTQMDYWSIDGDEKKMKVLRAAVERIRPVVGGVVKVRDDGDELHVPGAFQGRPARLVFHRHSADAQIEIKTNREFRHLLLRYSDEALDHPSGAGDRDAWDEQDDSEMKHFVSPEAPHVFFEDDRRSLERLRARWEALPPGLTNTVARLLEADKFAGGSFMVSGDVVTLRVSAAVTLSDRAPQMFGEYLALAAALAGHMELLWPEADEDRQHRAGPAPGYPMGGNVLVTGQDGNRYPATVLQVGGEQVLCAFPNRQQQWVPVASVTRA